METEAVQNKTPGKGNAKKKKKKNNTAPGRGNNWQRAPAEIPTKLGAGSKKCSRRLVEGWPLCWGGRTAPEALATLSRPLLRSNLRRARRSAAPGPSRHVAEIAPYIHQSDFGRRILNFLKCRPQKAPGKKQARAQLIESRGVVIEQADARQEGVGC